MIMASCSTCCRRCRSGREAHLRDRAHAQRPPDLIHEQQRGVASQGPVGGAAGAGARRAHRSRSPRRRSMTDTVPKIPIADRPRFDCRNAYVETLAELAHENHRIVGVVNDSVGSSKLDAFKRAFPDRLINGYRRARHGWRGRGTRQRRSHCFRICRILLPDRTSAGTDQSRRRVLESQREVMWHEPGNGVRRARSHPSLHRGHRLAGPSTTSPSWCQPIRSRRPQPCAGRQRRKAQCSFASAG